MTYINNPFQQRNLGWECPKCGSVYAPATPQCFKCGPKSHNISGTAADVVPPELKATGGSSYGNATNKI